MSRWSPTVVPWAKDPWEIQGQLVGQLGTASRLKDIRKRTDIYGREADQRIAQSQGSERRADQTQDVWFAEKGGMTPEMEAEAREQYDTQAGGVGGQAPEQAPIPGGNPMHPGYAGTQGINQDAPPLGGQGEPGNLVDQLRLELAGGGSVAAPGSRPADEAARRTTAERGGSLADALESRDVYSPTAEERGYMELTGQQPFTPQHQAAGFVDEGSQLDFEYGKNSVSSQVIAAQIQRLTAGQNRGLTANQVREGQRVQAINWISAKMREEGVTAAEAWQMAPPVIQNLVTAGDVGGDVYQSGRPGAYTQGAFSGDPENPLEAEWNPRAANAMQAVQMGADPNAERQKLAGDPVAIQAFDRSMMQRDRSNDLAKWIQGGLLTEF